MNSRRLQRRGAKVSKTLQSRLVPRTTPPRLSPPPVLAVGEFQGIRELCTVGSENASFPPPPKVPLIRYYHEVESWKRSKVVKTTKVYGCVPGQVS